MTPKGDVVPDRTFTIQAGPGEFDAIPCRYDLERRKLVVDQVAINPETGLKELMPITIVPQSADPLHQQIWELALPEMERLHGLEGQNLDGTPNTQPMDPTMAVGMADDEDEDMTWNDPMPSGAPGFATQTHQRIGRIPNMQQQRTNGSPPAAPPEPAVDVGQIVLINTQHQTLNMLMGFLRKHLPEDDGDWNIVDMMWNHMLSVYQDVTGQPMEEQARDE